ncbi:MAG: threonylcarbamoyl-AMP synthase [Dehalococcoidia bacterium]|nr:threonylcarbamoyl-AMP synthase [Dehalococcoidia bacterium]
MPPIGPERLDLIIAAIARGEVVAIPTDTVYGLVAGADDASAVARIAKLKGRSAEQPVQLLVSSIEAIAPYLDAPRAIERVRAFWPGAVTAVVRVRPGFASAVVTPEGTAGIRMPDDALALAVIEGCGGFLAASSANRHGEAPALSAAAVVAVFGEELLVLDGGPRDGGVASTVVDLSSDPPRVLRAGPVSARDLGVGPDVAG